jgi:hypothetical protein
MEIEFHRQLINIVCVDGKRVVDAVLIVDKHPDFVCSVVIDLVVIGISIQVALCVVGIILGSLRDDGVGQNDRDNRRGDLNDASFAVVLFDGRNEIPKIGSWWPACIFACERIGRIPDRPVVFAIGIAGPKFCSAIVIGADKVQKAASVVVSK